MGTFFSALKRRNVFRVAAAYLVVAWLILQLVSVITPMVILPDWFGGFVLVVLIIGFPLACLFAWAFELTPEGFKRTVEVEPAQSIRAQTGRKLDRAIIAVLALVVAVLLFDRFYVREPPAPAVADSSEQEVTIAVLPFADLSQAGDQEYFSDGLSEEIINVLVKVTMSEIVLLGPMVSTRLPLDLSMSDIFIGTLFQEAPSCSVCGSGILDVGPW